MSSNNRCRPARPRGNLESKRQADGSYLVFSGRLRLVGSCFVATSSNSSTENVPLPCHQEDYDSIHSFALEEPSQTGFPNTTYRSQKFTQKNDKQQFYSAKARALKNMPLLPSLDDTEEDIEAADKSHDRNSRTLKRNKADNDNDDDNMRYPFRRRFRSMVGRTGCPLATLKDDERCYSEDGPQPFTGSSGTALPSQLVICNYMPSVGDKRRRGYGMKKRSAGCGLLSHPHYLRINRRRRPLATTQDSKSSNNCEEGPKLNGLPMPTGNSGLAFAMNKNHEEVHTTTAHAPHELSKRFHTQEEDGEAEDMLAALKDFPTKDEDKEAEVMLAALKEIGGLDDDQENRCAIRTLISQASKRPGRGMMPDICDVVAFIVQKRSEAEFLEATAATYPTHSPQKHGDDPLALEDAKLMDQVRLASEQARESKKKGFRERRENEERVKLMESTMEEWLDPPSEEDRRSTLR